MARRMGLLWVTSVFIRGISIHASTEYSLLIMEHMELLSCPAVFLPKSYA